MPDPELLVALGNQFIHPRAQRFGHEQVKATCDMERLGIVAPGEIDQIGAPVSRDFDHDLVRTAPFEMPLVGAGNILDQQQRIFVADVADIFHLVVHLYPACSSICERARTICR